jgi:hypothetical protein
MAQPRTPPSNREREHENLRVPPESGEPPRAATEPPGSEWSVRTDKTETDPVSGEPHDSRKHRVRAQRAKLKPASDSNRHTHG